MDPAIYVEINPELMFCRNPRNNIMYQVNIAIGTARGRGLCPVAFLLEKTYFDKLINEIALQGRICPEIRLGDGDVIMFRGFPIMWVEII